MKKSTKIISLLMSALLAFGGLTACASPNVSEEEKKDPIVNEEEKKDPIVDEEEKKDPIVDEEEKKVLEANMYNGEVLDLTPEVYQPYLALTKESDMAEFLYKQEIKTPVIAGKGVPLSWEKNTSASTYTVRVFNTQDMKSQIFIRTTENSTCVVDGLMPGTYYWQVADNLGNKSELDYFVVGNYVRAMNVDEIQNFRDMGGWKTESGKTIKYGLTYRSSALVSHNASWLLDMGIRTEVDLRAGEEYAESVIPKEYGINFLQAGIMQDDYVLKDKSFYSSLTPEQIEEKGHADAPFKQAYADALYEAFMLYTDIDNYPILFHCTSGADRTGTFAFLLNGMLGVEVENLYKDFELTSFAMGGKRWRSNIECDENGNYYFNDDGYVTREGNYIAIGLLYKGLMECYSTEEGTLSSAIKNYLRKDVGLTDEDFEAIENIMLA